MGYRDDLEAAQLRIRDLEAALADARAPKTLMAKPERSGGKGEVAVPAVRRRLEEYEEKLAAAETALGLAEQRIADLEASPRPDPRVTALEAEVAALEVTAARLRAEVAKIDAAAARLQTEVAAHRAAERPPTLLEVNRAAAARGAAPELAGPVLCPLCLLAGERSVMVVAGAPRLAVFDAGELRPWPTASCPRCGLLHPFVGAAQSSSAR
ncbi:MAG: hypothetical protein IT373_30585 [Polyangiaceae bacterium]|nr:hypothetical protein [Polyangiaceae bacterium]